MPAEPDRTFDAEDFLAHLTQRPGVYQMVGEGGEVLYVGKARNLKNRVTSYFRASGLTTKTLALVDRIRDIRVTVTSSETEALLLEQSLIKEERPPYNIVLRDDKSYPYIYLTGDENYPRLCFHRGAKRRTGRYFGPFPSAAAVRDSLNILQKVFQLRQCDDTFFKNRSRPCLQYQINRCTAPCVGRIEPEEYAQDVRLAVMFLEGKNKDVLDEFKTQMERCAEALQFERAARYRDQIAHLTRVQEQQYVHGAAGEVDVVALARDRGSACVLVMFIRQGRLLGTKTWFPRDQLDSSEPELLGAFLSQFYLATGQGRADIPRDVITSVEAADADILAEALTATAARKVSIVSRVRGQRARWLELAVSNAEQTLATHLRDREHVYARFEALQEALKLEAMPQRLECFDISHTRGEATVASCVVFDTNGPLKSDYRRFNIEGVAPGDDYGAIAQALTRRYTRLKRGEGKLPDVLFIDGGRGQLTEARKVLTELQVEDVAIVAVAKGRSRRPGLETLITPSGEISLDPSGSAMHLIQHIRDEAHRFAITGHRQRRGKKRRESELDGIAGVGPKRRKELLSHFGGIRGVKGASVEELAKVPGISRRLAAQVYAELHNE
ncbi:MAG: excinuclease ABC subunit UvrC [Gammaproteobacteria bacterium]|jgi:excinuclease ABC subunit C